jgi:hypothetical protein
MKKTFLFLGATLATASTFISCTQETKTKNYYGVEQDNAGIPKEAYWTFFAVLIGFGLFLLWIFKRASKNK